MPDVRLSPELLALDALAYGDVVRRVRDAARQLSAEVSACDGALAAEVGELGRAAEHAVDVLASDHAQLQAGLAAVASCYLQLDRALFR